MAGENCPVLNICIYHKKDNPSNDKNLKRLYSDEKKISVLVSFSKKVILGLTNLLDF